MMHLGEGSGVFAFFVVVGYSSDADIQRWVKGFHKGRLAHTGMTREQANLILHQGLQLLNLEARLGRDAERGIAKALIIFH